MRGSKVVVAGSLLWVMHAVGAPSAAGQIVPDKAIRDPAGAAIIYVARRGWHIDIGFDAADLQRPLESTPRSPVKTGLQSLVSEFPAVRYLFFGFGDEHYLLAKHRNAPVMLAALWPGRGMILATGLKSPPSDAFGPDHVIALNVTRAQLEAAEDFVQRSLEVGAGGDSIRPFAPGPYEGSLYFSSKDQYSALHTCNTWAAQVLEAGGLSVHSVGVVFAGQLWTQARRLARRQAAAAQSVVGRRASLLPRRPTVSVRSIALSACNQEQGGFVPS